MPTPRNIDYLMVFRRVNDQLIAEHTDNTTSPPQVSDEVKADVRDHMRGAIAYVESTPALNQHYVKLSNDEIADVAYKYALALAKGKRVDMDGERIDDSYLSKQLTTIPPVAEELADPVSLTPTIPVPPKPKLGHLLDDPGNMRIFKQQISNAASRSGPEQAWATFIKRQFDEGMTADVVRLYKAMDVLTEQYSEKGVADFGSDAQGIKEFEKLLSHQQRKIMVGMLLERVVDAQEDRHLLNPMRHILPKTSYGITRRATLGIIGASALEVFGILDHFEAQKMSDEAAGVKPPPKQPEKKPELKKEMTDEEKRAARRADPTRKEKDIQFFGSDAKDLEIEKASKAKLEAAIIKDRVGLAKIAGGLLVGLLGGYDAFRRMRLPHTQPVKDEKQRMLQNADSVTHRTQVKIREADDAHGAGHESP